MMTAPLILAYDTSAAHCAVAVLKGETVLAERAEPMTKGQAERLFGLIDEVLIAADVLRGDLTAIGVCIGPGNFTGVRVGVSAARGLALALEIPAIGVSRLEAMGLGHDDTATVALDARRNRLYLQDFSGGVATAEPELIYAQDLTDTGGLMILAPEDPHVELFKHTAKPVHPLAVAVGLLAQARLGQDNPRPAPMYLQQPDAALPSDPPPKILS